jgi:hypothetical protein
MCCRVAPVDHSIRNLHQKTRSATKAKCFQPAADKENPAKGVKGAFLASMKSQLNQLADTVKDISINVPVKPAAAAALTSAAKKRDIILKMDLSTTQQHYPESVPPFQSAELCLNEILTAFREDKQMAEKALLFASRSGKLYPHEFREYIRAFRSPSPKPMTRTGRLPFEEFDDDNISVEPSNKRVKIVSPQYFKLLSPLTQSAAGNNLGKMIQLLDEEEQWTASNSAMTPQALGGLMAASSTKRNRSLRKSIENNSLLGTPLAPSMPSTPIVQPCNPEPASACKEINTKISSVVESVLAPAEITCSAPMEFNPFKANPRVARTPPKPNATTVEQLADPTEPETNIEGTNIVDVSINLSILAATSVPNTPHAASTTIHSSRMETSMLLLNAVNSFTKDELDHVSAVISRVSLGTTEREPECTAESVTDHQTEQKSDNGESLAFLHQEIQRLKIELELAKQGHFAPKQDDEINNEPAPNNMEIAQSVYLTDTCESTEEDGETAKAPADLSIDEQIRFARQRSEQLAEQQRVIRDSYNKRVERISLLKADITKDELNRTADIVSRRLSLKKMEPSIFDRSVNLSDGCSPLSPGNQAKKIAAEFVGFTEPVAVMNKDVVPITPRKQADTVSEQECFNSPSNVPAFMETFEQFVPMSSSLFSVPAPKRPMAQVYGDPTHLRLMFAGRVGGGLDVKSRASQVEASKFASSAFAMPARPVKPIAIVSKRDKTPEPVANGTADVKLSCKRKQEDVQLAHPAVAVSVSKVALIPISPVKSGTINEVAVTELTPIAMPSTAAGDCPMSFAKEIMCEPEYEMNFDDSGMDFLHCDNSNHLNTSISNDLKDPVGEDLDDVEKQIVASVVTKVRLQGETQASSSRKKKQAKPVKVEKSTNSHEPNSRTIGTRLRFVPLKSAVTVNLDVMDSIEVSTGGDFSPLDIPMAPVQPKQPKKPRNKTIAEKTVVQEIVAAIPPKETKKRSRQVESKQDALVVMPVEPELSAAGAGVHSKSRGRPRKAPSSVVPAVARVDDVVSSDQREEVSDNVEAAEAPVSSIANIRKQAIVKEAPVAATVRPKSSFAYFCDSRLPALRKSHPNASEIERVSMATQEYKKLGETEKAAWSDRGKVSANESTTTASKDVEIQEDPAVSEEPVVVVEEVQKTKKLRTAGAKDKVNEMSTLRTGLSLSERIGEDSDIDVENAFDNGLQAKSKRGRKASAAATKASKKNGNMSTVAPKNAENFSVSPTAPVVVIQEEVQSAAVEPAAAKADEGISVEEILSKQASVVTKSRKEATNKKRALKDVSDNNQNSSAVQNTPIKPTKATKAKKITDVEDENNAKKVEPAVPKGTQSLDASVSSRISVKSANPIYKAREQLDNSVMVSQFVFISTCWSRALTNCLLMLFQTNASVMSRPMNKFVLPKLKKAL